MFSHLERPALARVGWHQLLADFSPLYAANGFIGLMFAATARWPSGVSGSLREAELASWFFGSFFFNGPVTILMCWLYVSH